MTWKKYRKKTIQLMRDYIPGESLEDISIATKEIPPKIGGKIARDESGNQWYISPEFMAQNYVEVID